MAFDLDRAIRRLERQTGAVVEAGPDSLVAADPELGGLLFAQKLGPPSKIPDQVKELHEQIYRRRGMEQFFNQGGRCALCGEKMSGFEGTEIDHIESRGANGRDDRMKNLRVVHGGLNYRACHRKRHGERIAG